MTESRSTPPAPEARYDDEIDLVDLAIALWRRKWVIIGVALVVTGVSVAYALSKGSKPSIHQYTSIFALPTLLVSSSANKNLMDAFPPSLSPQEATELAQQVYIPAAQKSLGVKQAVSVENPKDTKLLVLTSEGPEAARHKIVQLQKMIIHRLDAEIQAQIDSIHAVGDQARSQARNGTGGGAESHAKLFSGPGRIVVLGQEHQVPAKKKTALIIVLGVILGIFAGVLTALMIGFVGTVRERLADRGSPS